MQRHTCSAVIIGFLALSFLALAVSAAAQTATTTASATSASAQVPTVIQFADIATDAAGGPLTGTVEIKATGTANTAAGFTAKSMTPPAAVLAFCKSQGTDPQAARADRPGRRPRQLGIRPNHESHRRTL